MLFFYTAAFSCDFFVTIYSRSFVFMEDKSLDFNSNLFGYTKINTIVISINKTVLSLITRFVWNDLFKKSGEGSNLNQNITVTAFFFNKDISHG